MFVVNSRLGLSSARDLRDLSIDLNRTRELAPKLGHNVTVISESGINTYAQVRELSHFANGFLIGSALMAHDDLNAPCVGCCWVRISMWPDTWARC